MKNRALVGMLLALVVTGAEANSMLDWLRAKAGSVTPQNPQSVTGSGNASSNAPLTVKDCNITKVAEASKDMQKKTAEDRLKLNGAMAQAQACVDKYKNFSALPTWGLPDLSTLLGQVVGQACSLADAEIAKATSPFNKAMNQTVNIGGVNVGGNAGMNVGIMNGTQSPVQSPRGGFNNSVSLPNIFR